MYGAQPVPPPAVRSAAVICWALAVLTILAATVLTYGLVTVRAPEDAPAGTASSWLWIGTVALRYAVAGLVIFGSLLVAGLWAWAASAARAGRGWSRVLIGLLCAGALFVAIVLMTLVEMQASMTGYALFAVIAGWALFVGSAAALVAVLLPPARAYFTTMAARRDARRAQPPYPPVPYGPPPGGNQSGYR